MMVMASVLPVERPLASLSDFQRWKAFKV